MAASIILDCDPGHDDAIAVLVALGSPEVDLIGGNHGLDEVTYNARAVCELAGFPDVPVHAGARRPLVREAIDAAEIHGGRGSTAWSFLNRPANSPSGMRSAG